MTPERLAHLRAFQTGPAADCRDCLELLNHIEWLQFALEQSVRLQTHYAQLLNEWDGGERLSFDSAHAWLDRIDYLKRRGQP